MTTLFRGTRPATFLARRERVFEALGRGAMVLPGAPVRFASRDTEFRFRPDPELFYVSGLEESDAVAVLRGHAKEERFVLFVLPRDPKAERWSGPRLGPEEAMARYCADAAYPLAELGQRLPALLEDADRVYFRLDHAPAVEEPVRVALRRARSRGPRTGAGPRGLVDPGEILDDMRLVKGEEELALIRKAAEVSERGMEAAVGALKPGVGEWEIEAAFEGTSRALGASGPSFPSIVASGPNACVLHYVDNSRVVGPHDLVLIDAGALVDLYCGDITRTFPASGTFSGEQRAVYEVVEKAREAGVQAVRPGASVDGDVHGAAVRVLVEGLVELGALEGDTQGLIEEKKYEAFYPHRTAHWLGLDVHDPGDYARSGKGRALGPGMVLTVEPGLYFPPGGEGVPERFQGIGVRIEDDVVVTPHGREVLTARLPTAASEVEAWVRAGRLQR